MIGLRIMLHHGHYLQLVMDDAVAFKTVNDYAAKALPDRISSHNVKCLVPPSQQWACDTSAIIGMHTCSLAPEGQGQVQGGYHPGFGRSGL